MRLRDKVAIVTGSTRGIGRTIAEMFAAEGASVAVSGRRVEAGEKVVSVIQKNGGNAEYFHLDLADENSVQATMNSVARKFGKIDVLVNNGAPTEAVAPMIKPLIEYSTDEWNQMLEGGLTGAVFWACKYGIPHLIKAGGGSVINVSSNLANFAHEGFSAYSAIKGAMNSVTRIVAVENGKHNIRANNIIVGRVSHDRRGADAELSAPGYLTRVGIPADIGHCAVWLASDESVYITGASITADGGFSINADAIDPVGANIQAMMKG